MFFRLESFYLCRVQDVVSPTTSTHSRLSLSLSQILLFPHRYGYFKIVSSSSATPTNSRPGVFSLEKRAKWDAWKAAGETLLSDGSDIAEAAKLRYTNIVRVTMGAGELNSLS